MLAPFGVNFINVFTCSFYTRRSQKRKKLPELTVFFALLRSVRVRAARNMLVKLTSSHVSLFFLSFYLQELFYPSGMAVVFDEDPPPPRPLPELSNFLPPSQFVLLSNWRARLVCQRTGKKQLWRNKEEERKRANETKENIGKRYNENFRENE